MNKTILLEKRPVGKPTLNDFKFSQEVIPSAHDGELLLKTLYVSVDPYLRGRMSEAKSYSLPFELNKPIKSGIIAEVMKSHVTGFEAGDIVSGNLDWKEYQISDGKGLTKLDKSVPELSSYLGILGMTGLTALLGLTEIGMPLFGETLVVSGAAGAVGSVVGQIGKIMGCRTVGITGSDEKAKQLVSKFKYDAAINYKTGTDLTSAIKLECPQGVDIYFDNVGGEISDAVLANINKHSRTIICGSISLYNNTAVPVGPRIQPLLLTRSSLMRGFIIGDFMDKFPAALKQLSDWVKEEKLVYSETVVEGFDNIPQAFIDLFEGKNMGKMIVKIQETERV